MLKKEAKIKHPGICKKCNPEYDRLYWRNRENRNERRLMHHYQYVIDCIMEMRKYNAPDICLDTIINSYSEKNLWDDVDYTEKDRRRRWEEMKEQFVQILFYMGYTEKKEIDGNIFYSNPALNKNCN